MSYTLTIKFIPTFSIFVLLIEYAKADAPIFFPISSAKTLIYVPDEHYILDYKGRCSLLIYGQHADGDAYDQFAVGNYGIEGKRGTYMDAEDGELSNSAAEHGGVDSVLRAQAAVS